MVYVEKLQGFDYTISIDFSYNLNKESSSVKGMRIAIIEEVFSRVTSFHK